METRRRGHFRIRTGRFQCGSTPHRSPTQAGPLPHRKRALPVRFRPRTADSATAQPPPSAAADLGRCAPSTDSRVRARSRGCRPDARRSRAASRCGVKNAPSTSAGAKSASEAGVCDAFLTPQREPAPFSTPQRPRTARPGPARLSGCWRGRPEGSARQRMPRHQARPRSRRRAGRRPGVRGR